MSNNSLRSSSSLASRFRRRPPASLAPSHENHEMNETRPSSGGESEATASLLALDGPDLRPRTPSNDAAQSTPKTPTSAPRTCRSKYSSFFTKTSSWWWWEISGCLLCILSSLLLVVFLTQIDQMARHDWTYRLQPNTIISIITTIGKAAMMVPIAACISQLKWTEFRRPARLSLLQSIDDASRGPWGSLVLLTRARRTRVLLIPALAFLTVAAVGFEPSAQQILDFPSRTALLRNASAEIGMATAYTSAQNVGGEERLDNPAGFSLSASYATRYRLQSTITLSFVQSPPNQAFSCPGSSCSWKPFSTLAVCGSCKNVTDELRHNCTFKEEKEYTNEWGDLDADPALWACTYTFPGFNRSHDLPYYMYSGYNPDSYIRRDLLLTDESTLNRSGIGFNVIKVQNETKFEMDQPPRFEGYTIEWHWCAKTFHNLSVSQGELNVGTTTSEALQFHAEDKIEDANLTTWSTSSSNTLYKTLPTPFWGHIKSWFNGARLDWGLVGERDADRDAGRDAAEIIYAADLAQMADNVASVLSRLVWSNETDNLSAEKFLGSAFVTESYIHVRWQWTAVVLVEGLLAAALLVASIIAVRGDPLPKASVIALLVHGLEDWRDIEVLHPETSATLEESSEEVVVRLMDNGAGRRLFVKQTTE